ncbi:MAG: DM13 domain-containing protein [Nitrosopumilaceae archaeon]
MNKGILTAIIVGVIAVGSFLASPLFYETEVDEPLPVALNNIEEGLTLEKFSEMEEQQRQIIVAKMPQKVKDMIMEESATLPTAVSEEIDDMMDKDSSKENSVVITNTGEFEGLAGHKAKGIANIIQANDMTFLRFEEFEVTNGPDLRVYITQNGNVHDGIHLDKLKGSRGDQNYLLENIDIKVYNTVVIYCQPFGAYFAQAELN